MVISELDYPFVSVEEELKQEEEFLRSCDSVDQHNTYIRFWESDQYCVVLGRSNRSETEANVDVCEADGVPIIQRCSGGGTVLQGPGCLNYSFIMNLSVHDALQHIDSTNLFIMNSVKDSLLPLNSEITVNGITDLTIRNKKFSGNAQRRLRHVLLFHGTILYDFELSNIEKYLSFPSKSPDYRDQRSHLEFLMNFPYSSGDIKKCLLAYMVNLTSLPA